MFGKNRRDDSTQINDALPIRSKKENSWMVPWWAHTDVRESLVGGDKEEAFRNHPSPQILVFQSAPTLTDDGRDLNAGRTHRRGDHRRQVFIELHSTNRHQATSVLCAASAAYKSAD